ncbi:EexN family lipoprotein, partial [Campylobacter coli]
KIKECDKNANSAKTDTECANAYKANYSKSLQKPRESAMEFFKNNK